jgi:hypothetical protein
MTYAKEIGTHLANVIREMVDLYEAEGEGYDHSFKNVHGDNTSDYGYEEHPLHKHFKAAGFHLSHSNHEDGNHSHTYVKGHTTGVASSKPEDHDHHSITTHYHDENAFKPNWKHTHTPKGFVFGHDRTNDYSGKGHESLKKHLTSQAVR